MSIESARPLPAVMERSGDRQTSLRRLAGRAWIHVVLILGSFLMLFPFVWMSLTAFKSRTEAIRNPPVLLPAIWHPENFVLAWQMAPWGRYFLNTIAVAGITTLLVLVTSTLAAYAFARMDFPGKNVLFVLFLATMMIPNEVTLIPNFVMITNLGWYNTYFALIVPWTVSVFAIFLLRQFFLGIPQELHDAAVIDGCGELRFFWQVAIPLARPALFTVGLVTILGSWNSLLWPLVVTRDESMRLLQVGLQAFETEVSTNYHLMMAAALFTMAPIILLYFFLQRQFIETMASSGVKG